MVDRLVVCIDGTWNGQPGKDITHVHRVVELIKPTTSNGSNQRTMYLHGVGVGGPINRLLGGIWGAGSDLRIREAYGFVCDKYRPGDELVFFGFSRGAFAARALAGIIATQGIVPEGDMGDVRQVFRAYREPDPLIAQKMVELLVRAGRLNRVTVRFVGVWDTVVRHGPLTRSLRWVLSRATSSSFGLHDARVPPAVRSLAHALALDEQRGAFQPSRVERPHAEGDQRIEEVWFAGSHSDVGGGYSDWRASEPALRWMLEEAGRAGVEFQRLPTWTENPHEAPLNPSLVGGWQYLPRTQRTVGPNDVLHDSVLSRLSATDYLPAARVSTSLLQSKNRS